MCSIQVIISSIMFTWKVWRIEKKKKRFLLSCFRLYIFTMLVKMMFMFILNVHFFLSLHLVLFSSGLVGSSKRFTYINIRPWYLYKWFTFQINQPSQLEWMDSWNKRYSSFWLRNLWMSTINWSQNVDKCIPFGYW